MDKREMIERALGLFEPEYDGMGQPIVAEWEPLIQIKLDALAEQAIVIECEVEHIYYPDGKPFTRVHVEGIGVHVKQGHHGTPGKALAIIVRVDDKRG